MASLNAWGNVKGIICWQHSASHEVNSNSIWYYIHICMGVVRRLSVDCLGVACADRHGALSLRVMGTEWGNGLRIAWSLRRAQKLEPFCFSRSHLTSCISAMATHPPLFDANNQIAIAIRAVEFRGRARRVSNGVRGHRRTDRHKPPHPSATARSKILARLKRRSQYGPLLGTTRQKPGDRPLCQTSIWNWKNRVRGGA